MFRSLQLRLTISFLAIIMATVVCLGLSLTLLSVQLVHDQYEATYRSNAQAAYSTLHSALIDIALRRVTLSDVVHRLSTDFHFRVRVSVYSDPPLSADSGPPQADPNGPLKPDDFPRIHQAYTAVGQTGTSIVFGTLDISQPLTDRAARQQEFVLRIAWAMVAAALVSGIASSMLAERLTAPFTSLARVAAQMNAGSLSTRVAEDRRDEAGELARQFNRMAQRLEDSFSALSLERDRLSADRDRLREFVAEVSHELRTPLTAMRTFNDLLQNGAGENPVTRHDFLQESARQIERLDWLTRNLLDLSRLDAGITRLAAQQTDLGDLLQQVVNTNKPAAAAKSITLAYTGRSIIVDCDPPWIEQALSNIVGNAIKFSPCGTTVEIALEATGGEAVIIVRDEGSGIPPDEIPHVFDRFYRGRSANRSGEGSGLGLAIAKAVIDVHHGTIAMESTVGVGTTVRIAIPLQSAIPSSL